MILRPQQRSWNQASEQEAHNLCDKGVFLLQIFNFDDPLSLIFTGLLFMLMLRYTSEKTGLWQLPKVYSAFKWTVETEIPFVCFKEVKARMCQDTLLQSEPIHHYFKCQTHLYGTYRSMCKHKEELSSCSFTFTLVPSGTKSLKQIKKNNK